MTSFCQRTRSCVHSLNSRGSTPLFAEGAAQTENSPRECPASEAKHPKSPFNPRASWLTSQFSGDVIRANQIDFFFFSNRDRFQNRVWFLVLSYCLRELPFSQRHTLTAGFFHSCWWLVPHCLPFTGHLNPFRLQNIIYYLSDSQ